MASKRSSGRFHLYVMIQITGENVRGCYLFDSISYSMMKEFQSMGLMDYTRSFKCIAFFSQQVLQNAKGESSAILGKTRPGSGW